MFQPTHPHGVRPLRYKTDQIQLAFQPTHPRGVRLVTPDVTASAYNVSTHAPARGATAWQVYRQCWSSFQPTHPHGVRLCLAQGYHDWCGFNPRTRTGCDGCIDIAVETQAVSTHAPARGATLYIPLLTGLQISFNPRTRTGCDGGMQLSVIMSPSFNPRTRTGCDPPRRFEYGAIS